jgi:hypothetical protein
MIKVKTCQHGFLRLRNEGSDELERIQITRTPIAKTKKCLIEFDRFDWVDPRNDHRRKQQYNCDDNKN